MKKNKCLTIYHELSHKIQKRDLKPNTFLPSENQLVNQYSASRETVRKALNLLAHDGYIQKIKGKGSIILDINNSLDTFPFEDTIYLTENRDTNILYNIELINPDHHIQQRMNVSRTDYVWKILRGRTSKGKEFVLDKMYFSKSFVPNLTREIRKESILEFLDEKLRLKISFIQTEITVEESPRETYNYLKFRNNPYVIIVRNYGYLEDTSLFHYVESYYNLDNFHYYNFERYYQS